ncbi:MAG: sulfatase-like hydrolase/transferase [Pirellulales bacterium]
MTRVFAAIAFACACLSGTATPAPPNPNIIFILADDLGIGNVGCYGADRYRTPHLDALAAGGIRFTRAYTAPLCGPSRALVMTGRYPFRTGATNQDAVGRMRPEAEPMIPAHLARAGYVSACVGKWGQLPLQPAAFGFDDSLTFRGSGVYWNTTAKARTYRVDGREHPLADGQYLPDLMHAHVVDFITRHRDEPFFVYYSLSHVHSDLARTPDSGPAPDDLLADNIAYMDTLVGRLVAALERLGLRERTLVVFMGDNGTGEAHADEATIGGRRLAGQKGSMLEGGALVPLIVNWPGTTRAGDVSADVIDSTDFVPTFAELAGATLPAGHMIDGHSFAAQLRGLPARPRPWAFVQLARSWYVRDTGWKLDQKGDLFDMRDAPFTEPLVPPADDTDTSREARQRLTAALAALDPAGGVLDDGDGSGRHASKAAKRSPPPAPPPSGP